jgi:NtrC-family two-component system response regulator AlgB
MPLLLCIDDEAFIRRAVTRMFHGEAHAVGSVSEALEILGEWRYDVGLLDARLGAEDGIALLPLLRRAAPQTNWVVFSMATNSTDRMRALAAGAVAYVDKIHIDRIDELVMEFRSHRSDAPRREAMH